MSHAQARLLPTSRPVQTSPAGGGVLLSLASSRAARVGHQHCPTARVTSGRTRCRPSAAAVALGKSRWLPEQRVRASVVTLRRERAAVLLPRRLEAHVNAMATGRTFRRCGCRDRETGRRLGRRCPRLLDAGHGSWYLCLELGVGSDGQRCRLRCGGYPSQSEARRALAELRALSGGAPSRAGWTTGRWLARWLAGEQGLRPSSARRHVRLYLMPHLAGEPRLRSGRLASRW